MRAGRVVRERAAGEHADREHSHSLGLAFGEKTAVIGFFKRRPDRPASGRIGEAERRLHSIEPPAGRDRSQRFGVSYAREADQRNKTFVADSFQRVRDAVGPQHVVDAQRGRFVATLAGDRIVQLQQRHATRSQAPATGGKRFANRLIESPEVARREADFGRDLDAVERAQFVERGAKVGFRAAFAIAGGRVEPVDAAIERMAE